MGIRTTVNDPGIALMNVQRALERAHVPETVLERAAWPSHVRVFGPRRTLERATAALRDAGYSVEIVQGGNLHLYVNRPLTTV